MKSPIAVTADRSRRRFRRWAFLPLGLLLLVMVAPTLFSGFSRPDPVAAQETTPGVPELTWRKASSTSVKLFWPTVTGATGYSVHRKAAFAADSTYTDSGVSTLTSSSTSATLSSLTTDTHYEVRVRAIKGSNVSHESVISVAAGIDRFAPTGCLETLGTIPTSGIQSKTSFWHPACTSRYTGPLHLSRYFSIATGPSGAAAFLVESCTEANLKIWKGNDVDTPKEGGLNKFDWVPELRSGSGSGHTGGTFKLGRATTLIRHLSKTDNDGNLITRSKLTPHQSYTIEVSSPYPGQLGNFKLQYGNDDANFEATPGFCSDGTTNSKMKSEPKGYSRCTAVFSLNSCLSYTDPAFWSTLNPRQRHDVLWGIYGGVWPGVTGPTGASGPSNAPPQPANPPTVSDTSKFKTHYATVGDAYSLVLPAADAGSGDGGPYDYLLWHKGAGKNFNDQAINGLSFNAVTRTLSGTPEEEGKWELSYVVHDGDDNRNAAADAFRERTNLKIIVLPGGGAVGNDGPQQSNNEPENPIEPQPSPPTASAGANFNGKRGEVRKLSGSGTAHANGSQTLKYQWTVKKASDSELATVAATFLTNADKAKASFTVPRRKHMKKNPSALDDGKWIEFQLTVTDGDNESATSTVRMTIQGSTWKK